MGNQSSNTTFNYDAQLLNDYGGLTQSVEYGPEAKDASRARRNARLKNVDQLMTKFLPDERDIHPEGGYSTLWDCLVRPSLKFPKNNALGTRVYVLRNETQYKLGSDKTPERGPYVWESYMDFDTAAREVGSGLITLGATSLESNIGIFSSNRAEWVHASFGCWSQSLRVVALYATLGEDAVEYITNHAELKIIFVSKDNIAHLLKVLPRIPCLTHIIQFDYNSKYKNVEDVVDPVHVDKAHTLNVQLLSLAELRLRGRKANNFPSPPKSNDLALIMYTSGTTGSPKGVMLSHGSCMAQIATVPTVAKLSSKDRYCSYLPLAHILETSVELSMFMHGASVGFFQNNVRKLTDDWIALKPTALVGVPRIFSRIYQQIIAGVAQRNCVVRYFFNRALNSQIALLRKRKPLDRGYDKKIFEPLRARVGLSEVQTVLTGSAPCPPYLLEFLHVVLGVPILQGYGMTESSAGISITRADDITRGHCGPPTVATEVRLLDVPEMGYLHTDNPPRGEILFRGPNAFLGYYKDEKSTKETIDEDGWVHTGDIGRWNPNGSLSVIDRKKNMFKLSQGEYVAAEKIEQQYGKSPVVGQIWVYGNSYKSMLMAVIVPAGEYMYRYALEQGWWPRSADATKLGTPQFSDDFYALLTGPHASEIKAHIAQSLKEVEKPLKGFERVKDFVLEPRVDNSLLGFTEANGCLTPTFKLRRPQLLIRYLKPLQKLYEQNGEPVNPNEKWPGTS